MRIYQRSAHLFIFSLLGPLLLSSASWAAESIPLKAVNRAAAVIDRAIEAHGGAEALEGITTAAQRSVFKNYASFQSLQPSPPWDVSYTDNFYAIDFANEIVVTTNKGEGSGFITDAVTLISPNDNLNIDLRAGTATPIAQPNFRNVAAPFVRVTPSLLVRALMLRRHTSHWLGEAEVGGSPADIVTLVMEVGPALSLYVDRKTGLLIKSERVLPPFGQIEYRYLDYDRENGFAVNRKFELFTNGEPNLSIELGPLALNEPIDQYLVVPDGLTRNAPTAPDVLQAYKLAEGVHLIGGTGTYAMFVENGDHIVAVGGTAGIAQRIKELRGLGVTKPIRFGVITHHHNDHILGVEPYAENGATIVGHEAHAEVIRGATANTIDLRTISDRHSLGEGTNRVELYDIGPTPHSEHILVAYLPEHGILFQADHSGIPRTGTPGPAQPAAVALHDAMARLAIDVKSYVSAHSPRIVTESELEHSVGLVSNGAGG